MLTQLSAMELAAGLRSKQFTAQEICDAQLQRISDQDADYGAYITVDEAGAREMAAHAQARIDDGTAEPLTGIPIALKDNISTLGVQTTCASKILAGYIPPFDATVVEKLRRSGSILLGKTNLDEFAMGTSTENSALQTTRNPWDMDLVPGGSSGGSAAAVSAELACMALGSDTGGSIRQPAALCGIVGFKPTYGRVSRYGLIAFGSSLDQIGPMARSVEEAAWLAAAISGHDHRDSTSLQNSEIRIDDLKSLPVKGLKIGLPTQMFGDSIQPDVRETVQVVIDQLTREGVEFREVSLPSIEYGVTTYYLIAPAEASSNLARFDGVRFGPRVEGEGHIGDISATRGNLFGHEVKLRIMIGTYALSAGYYDAYYHRAQQVRGMMADEFEAAFGEFDAILSPTSPCVAFPLGGYAGDGMALKLMDLCTIPANMGGFPSISIPSGTAQDLPVGLCITGPINTDERLLQIAYTLDRAMGRDYRRPPIL